MDHLEFCGLIGEGTYGAVYKVTNKTTKQLYACKVMRLHDEDEGIPSAALREIALLKVLNHPNVMRLEEIHHDHENLFIVVEHCEMDLKHYFDVLDGTIPPETVRDLTRQILLGLVHCHVKQVLHRDLKPQNILLNTSNMQIANSGKPLFPSNSVTDQLRMIFRVTGVPTERTWPRVSTLPEYKVIVPLLAAHRLQRSRAHVV
ncbi:Cyclin-dependent-like kinase 5 isoform X2 [Aphelenchoides fujianensis]|nr:Cyclin-dependent-like kinase 5 isoform X2 [Aphelenchoides fujianensis]